jgi:hypothetical protein
MAKIKTKSSRTTKKSSRKKSERGVGKAPDFGKVREKINTLVGGKAVGLVESAMDEAEKGHFTAMKYLFEMIGLYPTNGEEMPMVDNSLAKTLLRRMGLPEDLVNERPDTKDISDETVAAAADTVE